MATRAPYHTSPKAIEKTAAVRERERQAVQLRTAGLQLVAIAAQLGVSVAQASRDLANALDRHNATPEEVALLRDLEAARLDDSERRVVEVMVKPGVKPETILRAVMSRIRISERRSALLGLDLPKRVELSGAEGGPIELDANTFARVLANVEKAKMAIEAQTQDMPEEAAG